MSFLSGGSGGDADTIVSAAWRLLIRLWWRLLIISGVVFAGYRLRSIITTLCLSAIIAYVLDPAVEWLCRDRRFTAFHAGLFRWLGSLMPRSQSAPRQASHALKHHTIRTFAASYVFLIALVGLWQGGRLIVAPLASEVRELTSPRGRQELMRKKDEFLRWYDSAVPDVLRSDKIQEQIQNLDLGQPLQHLASEIAHGLMEGAKGIVEIVLIPVLAYYVLIDGRRLKHEFVGMVAMRHRRDAIGILNEFNRIMRAFISGQFILCLLAGVVIGAWLLVMHVKYAVVLAVFAGLTRAIPVVGPIFGSIPIMLVVLPQHSWTGAVSFAVFFSILHLVETKFIMPLLIGDRIELHPVLIIVVLLVGGEAGSLLLGNQLGSVLGMFFAAPLAALARVLIRRYMLKLPPRSPRPPVRGAALSSAPTRAVEVIEPR